MSEDELMEFQVKVPVCVTLHLKRGDAEWMTKEDLAYVVNAVLYRVQSTENELFSNLGTDNGFISFDFKVNPSWDNLPADECDLVYEDEEGFFPVQD